MISRTSKQQPSTFNAKFLKLFFAFLICTTLNFGSHVAFAGPRGAPILSDDILLPLLQQHQLDAVQMISAKLIENLNKFIRPKNRLKPSPFRRAAFS